MGRRKKLSLEQHTYLSKKLREIDIGISDVTKTVTRGYSLSSDPCKRLRSFLKCSERVKIILAKRLLEEWCDEEDFDVINDVYE